MMNDRAYNELNRKYTELLEENKQLREKIRVLEAASEQRGVSNDSSDNSFSSYVPADALSTETQIESHVAENTSKSMEIINKHSAASKKIQLFMSLFRSRNDVYAKRWKNKKGGSGYSPVCANEWEPRVCFKPKVKCFKCQNKSYSQLNEAVIEAHLTGSKVVGMYPMNPDETCYFLAMDFDKEGWQKDITAVKNVCQTFQIPVAVERSRSGNGGHIWFFFEDAISASTARKFGMSLLTKAMENRHELPFASYDRLFPNQDTMPEGGLGNLIALPLQKSARNQENTVFVDDRFQPLQDQWMFLSGLQRLSEQDLQDLTGKIGMGHELGLLKTETSDDDTPDGKPWIKKPPLIDKADFPKSVELVKAEMLFIKKKGFSQKALNRPKRLAAFKNPEFFKKQAMRMPTFNIPSVISCSEDIDGYLALPRGCESDIFDLLNDHNVTPELIEKYHSGKPINVEFNGMLRPEQQDALSHLIRHDTGVLCATTAFGKTIVGANLIARKKINTLILVHRQQLMLQWKKRLSQFLLIHETLPEPEKKRGRKKQAEKRPFAHYLIPRFTGFKTSLDEEGSPLKIQAIYSQIIEDDIRNQAIISDVVECHKKGRNSLVITGRIAHAKLLTKNLTRHIPDVILLTGGMGTKKSSAVLETLKKLPGNRHFVLVATGSYIGEGFDEARLDTLFLAMPISWKGTLQQYCL